MNPGGTDADRPAVTAPTDDVLRRVLRAFAAADVIAAVGGSGLLAAHGLVDVVHDWDLTTDAPPDRVRAALDTVALPVRDRTSREHPFRTQRLLTVDAGDHSIDVMIGFALADADGRQVELPTRVSGSWHGLPIGDPAVWREAYALLGRTDRAALLAGF